MAAGDKTTAVELTSLERQWVFLSITNQRAMLTRSRNKEFVGSEIWILRGKELDALAALSIKFA